MSCVLLFCYNLNINLCFCKYSKLHFSFKTGRVFIMYLSPIVLLLAGIANSTPVELSKRIKNGVGLTPAMGFNNWNSGLREFN